MDPQTRAQERERQHATVMFADITGFTPMCERMDPEDAYAIITACLKLLDGVAREHGGKLDKYLGDCLMVLFRVPDAARTSERAAVKTALEMRKCVARYNSEQKLEIPLGIHIGINSGLMISGDTSGSVIREFAVMGDAVNVAARLKDLTPPDAIYTGPEVYGRTHDEFEYRPLEPLKVKGKEERVAIFELISEKVRT